MVEHDESEDDRDYEDDGFIVDDGVLYPGPSNRN